MHMHCNREESHMAKEPAPSNSGGAKPPKKDNPTATPGIASRAAPAGDKKK